MSALDPVFTVGHQIAETLRVHTDVGKEEARERTLDMLRRVGIASPERRIDDYPHQLSGGMRQRVMIAASADLRAATPDRGRADHGARRHRAGADPGSAARPQRDLEHGADADHARPRRRRRDLHAHDHDVCRRGDRGCRGRRRAGAAAASLYVRPVALAAAFEPAPRQAALDPGPGALDRRHAQRLPLQGALPACHRRLREPSRNCSMRAPAARCAAGVSTSSICPAPCSTPQPRRSRPWSVSHERAGRRYRKPTPSSRCAISRCSSRPAIAAPP